MGGLNIVMIFFRLKKVKQITKYILWSILSIFIAISYLTFIIKPYELSTEGIDFLLFVFYGHGIFFVGSIIGLVIAFLFVLLDVFYLRKKLVNKKNSMLIRFSVLLVISVFIVVLHYLLEKAIDLI